MLNEFNANTPLLENLKHLNYNPNNNTFLITVSNHETGKERFIVTPSASLLGKPYLKTIVQKVSTNNTYLLYYLSLCIANRIALFIAEDILVIIKVYLLKMGIKLNCVLVKN